ncbi:hypothetical protein BT96DRAFT_1004431 [Gymnopus androsaceus JB14]|uniref:NAD-specific glutamate dehydrogenase second domain-containing protein n=1 Tax=Gymnopus androsaceus JB14 TaxID=1447944 RepID=A0A6A4GR99_9AGAR|nr:hypothetical protein BT96DRAFT_1004431 [Gymnopus androsaceus JB14]
MVHYPASDHATGLMPTHASKPSNPSPMKSSTTNSAAESPKNTPSKSSNPSYVRVEQCVFPDTPATKDEEGRTNINSVSDKGFLEKASENMLEINQKQWYGPVMEVFEVKGSRERRLVIGALSNLYHFYSLYSARKYVEQFSNSVTIISLYLNPIPNSNTLPIEHSIFQVMKEASLLFCLPKNPFFLPSAPGTHAVQEAMYAYCSWIFAQHFCNRLSLAYAIVDLLIPGKTPGIKETLVFPSFPHVTTAALDSSGGVNNWARLVIIT